MRRIVTRSSSWLVVGGVCTAVLAVVLPSTRYVWYTLAAVTFAVAVVLAVARGSIDRRVAFLVLAAGTCFISAVAAAAVITDQDLSDFAAVALGLCGTIVLIFGLFRLPLIRHGRARLGVFGDALIVGLGTWIVSWVTIVLPYLRAADGNRLLAALSSLLQPSESITLFLMVLLMFTRNVRQPAMWLLSGAVACSLGGDLVLALVRAQHVGRHADHVAVSLYVLGFAVAAAGVLHPSITSLTEPRASRSPQGALSRVIIATSSLVFPMVVLAIAEPRGTPDKLIRCASAVILAGAVTMRVVQAVHSTHQLQVELLCAAETDALTGLPTRALLLEHLEQSLQDSWHGDLRPALYFVDLDRFKNINDSLGHGAGDQVLRTVAQRLMLAIPERAIVARLSGDEYAVLDPAMADESSTLLADRLLDVFRDPIALQRGDVFVTASIGIATIDSNTRTDAEALLRHACSAMFRAKDAGRNCVVLFDESMHERVAHRMSVETALYRALDRHELRLYHQPILDIVNGDVVGFEALMRWQRDDGAIVSPAEFIPIAEDNGTIIPIGAWALLDALSQLRSWIDDGVCRPTATMSVNVSPRQLADPSFPSIVSEALARAGVEPNLLWLEITEGVMISEPELAFATLEKMKALGVLIALDDFGTGYSSLSMLQRFPLQRIKIDRAFVQGLAESTNDRSLVRTIVAMATSLDLDMVAEGVETVQQMQILRDLGCNKAQGYLISHPVPAAAMRSTVAALERLGRTSLLRGAARSAQN